MALPIVAVVGRANVGKSTLVNRLLGKRMAIEHPEPGVTRDRHGYEMEWNRVRFLLVDTGGWEPKARGLAAKVLAQAERAAQESDLILMVMDAQTGITEDDLVVAKGLRKAKVTVIPVANKVDSGTRERDVVGFERLGLGPAMGISALHGRGSGDLLDVVTTNLKALGERPTRGEQGPEALPVAIVGRPNVGKSSLFNRLVGDERSIVHDLPGTTRDAVDTVIEIGGNLYRFIDTAGMRRRAKDARGPEYYGLVRSLRAIDEAAVALHVIDAQEGPTEQDQKIAERVASAGCAGVIVVNKWDLIDAEIVDAVVRDIRDELRFVPWAQLVRTSALTKRGVAKIAPAIESVRAAWETRIQTATLNAWLREAVERVPLGNTVKGRPTRIRYVTQASVCPPAFVFFTNGTVSASATRALERRLRESFGFEGTPIKVIIRRQTREPKDR
jgi:GTPase